MALKELGSLLIQNSQLQGISPPCRQLGCEESTGGKGSQVNKSITGQPCLAALVLYTNSLLCRGFQPGSGGFEQGEAPGLHLQLGKSTAGCVGEALRAQSGEALDSQWKLGQKCWCSALCWVRGVCGDLGEREKFTGHRKGRDQRTEQALGCLS